MNISSRKSRRFALTGVAAAAALALAACGGTNDDAEGPTADDDGVTTLTVGGTPVPHGQILEFVSEELGEDAGLDIEIVEFDDFQLPNRQMDEGNLDANYFQHVPFLDQQIEDHGYEISHGDPIHLVCRLLLEKKNNASCRTPARAVIAPSHHHARTDTA